MDHSDACTREAVTSSQCVAQSVSTSCHSSQNECAQLNAANKYLRWEARGHAKRWLNFVHVWHGIAGLTRRPERKLRPIHFAANGEICRCVHSSRHEAGVSDMQRPKWNAISGARRCELEQTHAISQIRGTRMSVEKTMSAAAALGHAARPSNDFEEPLA